MAGTTINQITSTASTPVIFLLLIGITAVIVVCALIVVRQAEHLAHQLGEPYGTLILTLSIVLIEVVLICAVMLGPGNNATIARDSVMSVTMIILNLVIGIALIITDRKTTRQRSGHVEIRVNPTGFSSYFVLLTVLLVAVFALPGLISETGSYAPNQALVLSVAIALCYGFFLYLQLGRNRANFQEISAPPNAETRERPKESGLRKRRDGVQNGNLKLWMRAAVMVLAAIPIVAASSVLSTLLDEVLNRTGAPTAVSGLLIAAIVFLPETLTAWRAAAQGQLQRVSNLCHGALVSTVGLTIPAVLVTGLLTGQPVVLAESPAQLVLLAATLLVTYASFNSKRTTAVHGSAHLMLFGLYVLIVFP